MIRSDVGRNFYCKSCQIKTISLTIDHNGFIQDGAFLTRKS